MQFATVTNSTEKSCILRAIFINYLSNPILNFERYNLLHVLAFVPTPNPKLRINNKISHLLVWLLGKSDRALKFKLQKSQFYDGQFKRIS